MSKINSLVDLLNNIKSLFRELIRTDPPPLCGWGIKFFFGCHIFLGTPWTWLLLCLSFGNHLTLLDLPYPPEPPQFGSLKGFDHWSVIVFYLSFLKPSLTFLTPYHHNTSCWHLHDTNWHIPYTIWHLPDTFLTPSDIFLTPSDTYCHLLDTCQIFIF